MKKIIIRLTILTSAFVLGLGTFVLYYFSFLPEVAKPEFLPAQEIFDCKKSKDFPGLSRKISGIEKGKSGYFPKKAFNEGWENRDIFVNDWYGKHLRAMKEKSLLVTSDENIEIYRFLWLRTFHHPIFVRVERRGHSIELFSKELNGAGGYEPGRTWRSDNHDLTKEEWCEFMRLLEKANYWKLPTIDENLGGNDGAQWILEGVKDNRYHIVDRWTPDRGEYREACIYLLKLSGIDTDRLKDDLY